MIKILLHDEVMIMEKNQQLIHLIKLKFKSDDCFVVMLNKKFIPRGQYDSTVLSDGDVIEIIVPMQGG